MNDGLKDVTQRLEVSICWTPLATPSLGQSWIRGGDGKQFPLYFRRMRERAWCQRSLRSLESAT